MLTESQNPKKVLHQIIYCAYFRTRNSRFRKLTYIPFYSAPSLPFTMARMFQSSALGIRNQFSDANCLAKIVLFYSSSGLYKPYCAIGLCCAPHHLSVCHKLKQHCWLHSLKERHFLSKTKTNGKFRLRFQSQRCSLAWLKSRESLLECRCQLKLSMFWGNQIRFHLVENFQHCIDSYHFLTDNEPHAYIPIPRRSAGTFHFFIIVFHVYSARK